MKRTIAFAALSLLAAGDAWARTNWQGEAVVTGVNAACTADGEAVGSIYKVMFFPSGITDNGPNSFMTFYGYRNSFSVSVTGRPVANAAYTPIYINSYGKNLVPGAGKFTAFALTTTPAGALSTTTKFVTLTMTLTNWGAINGCTATLEAAFVRRR